MKTLFYGVLLTLFINLSFVVGAFADINTSCLQREPLGCSVPTSVQLASPQANYYTDKFASPCLNHDHCYRHGKKTYYYGKSHCDRNFLSEMRAICNDVNWLAVATGGLSVANCNVVAQAFYAAVSVAGDGSYAGDSGTCCAYEEDSPDNVSKACGGTRPPPRTGSLIPYKGPSTAATQSGGGTPVIQGKFGEGVECAMDTHCGSINKCINHRCEKGCTRNSQCPAGSLCAPQGVCMAH